MITLVLPLPPSTNNLFVNGKRGRFKSQKYKDWEEDAGLYLMQQKEWKSQKVIGPYELEILVSQKMRGDISNRIKAVEDMLVSIEATSDDSNAQRVSIERSADVPEHDCYVTVREFS